MRPDSECDDPGDHLADEGMEEILECIGELGIPVAKRNPVNDLTQRSIVEADAACKVCHDLFSL
jgi:hypothetical protein